MLHRQATFVPFERFRPAFRAIELHRAPCGVVAVARLFTVGACLSHQPAQRMIAIAGNTPGTVRRTDNLTGLVVLLIAAVAGGIDLFYNLAKLVPAQLRGLPQRIHHALQPVVFVVPEASRAAVCFND